MYDLETIVECVPRPLALTRCHSNHFRPHTTHFDLFMLFSMIACLYWTDHYINRLAMYSPSYSIPMQCISDPFRLFVDFIYLHSYRYSDVLCIYSSVDHTIAIGSDFDPYGLLVISNPSDTIATSPRLFLLMFYLPLSFYTAYHCTSFPQPCKTSHRLTLTQTAFPCIPSPYP